MEQNKSNFAIPAEQRQKWYSIALVWIGAMICVSSLMVGGMLGNGMKLGTCALTIVVGYGIVCIYMCFMGMQGCDTGLPTAVMAGGSLGEKGGKYVISAILALACIGWFGIQAAVCGASFSAMMESMTGLAIPAWLSSIIWGIIMVASASFGFKGLKWLNYIAVPLLIIVLIYGLVVTMVTHDGAAAIAAYEPAQPLTLLSGINITVGSFAIGGSLAGDYCRFAKNRSDVIKSSVVGVLPSGLLILLIGAVLSIVTGEYDISVVLTAAGVPAIGLVALIAATWTTNVTNAYSRRPVPVQPGGSGREPQPRLHRHRRSGGYHPGRCGHHEQVHRLPDPALCAHPRLRRRHYCRLLDRRQGQEGELRHPRRHLRPRHDRLPGGCLRGLSHRRHLYLL